MHISACSSQMLVSSHNECFTETCKHLFCKHYILNRFVFISKSGITSSCGLSLFCLMLWFFLFVFSGLTGYFRQEDVSGIKLLALLLSWSFYIPLEEDLTMLPHYPPSESGEYLISFFFTLFTFTSYYLNIGDNVHLKCKGVNYDTLENAITLDFCFI